MKIKFKKKREFVQNYGRNSKSLLDLTARLSKKRLESTSTAKHLRQENAI